MLGNNNKKKPSQSFCAESSGIPQKAQSSTIVKCWKGWKLESARAYKLHH